MRPAQLDLEMYAGDDYVLSLPFVDANDAPFALTGTFRSHLRRSRDSDLLVEFYVDVTDQATGTLRLRLTGAQVRSVAPGGVWDLERTDNSVVQSLLEGRFTVYPDVTR